MNFSDFLEYSPETGVLTRKLLGGGKKIGDIAGAVAPNGYVMVSVMNKQRRAHRVIWEIYYGAPPAGYIDHINGNRSDNRIENLRVVTKQENNKNKMVCNRNKSGVMGVTWEKDRSRWLAFIGVNKKSFKIGRFDNLLDAVCARKSAEFKFNYHPNHGRVDNE